MKRIARVIVSGELMAQVLRLPSGTQINSAKMADTPHGCDVEFLVEHYGLAGVDEGETPPVIGVQIYSREKESEWT